MDRDEGDAALLADLRLDWGKEYRITVGASGWVAADVTGSDVLRATSASGLRRLIEGSPEGSTEWPAGGGIGPGEQALRRLAEDGII